MTIRGSGDCIRRRRFTFIELMVVVLYFPFPEEAASAR